MGVAQILFGRDGARVEGEGGGEVDLGNAQAFVAEGGERTTGFLVLEREVAAVVVDADAALDMGGNAVSIALKSGEIWVFRHDGRARLALEQSVYLEKGRLKARLRQPDYGFR